MMRMDAYRTHRAAAFIRLHWLGFAMLAAILATLYLTLLSMGHGLGVGADYADFRAASLLLAHGGNPYDMEQLWKQENALYNVPWHLHPGDSGYYFVDEYRNPTLFAVILTPLARLSFERGFPVYTVGFIAAAIVGAWLLLRAFGWTRWRWLAIGIALISPSVFLSVWSGQQSTLLLGAFGLAIYALRREHPGFAGALMTIGWIKPHLLIPVALVAPLLLSRRACLRWYGGFCIATAAGIMLTIATTGTHSIVEWLYALIGYTGYTNTADVAKVDAIQSYLPSLSGMALVLLPHSLNKAVTIVVMALGMGALVWGAAYLRRQRIEPVVGMSILLAIWLIATPYVHANDDLLLLPALAVAWGRNGETGMRLWPLIALWSLSVLSLAFFLPDPWKLLGVLPPILVTLAAWRQGEGRKAEDESNRGRDVG